MNSFFPLLKVGFDLNLKCCFHEDAQFPLASLQAARYTYVLLSLPLQGFSLVRARGKFWRSVEPPSCEKIRFSILPKIFPGLAQVSLGFPRSLPHKKIQK